MCLLCIQYTATSLKYSTPAGLAISSVSGDRSTDSRAYREKNQAICFCDFLSLLKLKQTLGKRVKTPVSVLRPKEARGVGTEV